MIRRALHYRKQVMLFAVLVGAAGLISALDLPVDAVPDITGVQVVVNSATGAMAPEEAETAVTFPIETEMAGLPRVEDIRSLTRYGLSQVVVIFEDGT
ncbi:MAG: efflux RND transporter permease subunit, partial [Spirochaetia bacterium]|nr:efflux RND transporter permease subunit [Spirochaetia bacterium]